MEENPGWYPDFVHGTPAPQEAAATVDGGRRSPEAVEPPRPYIWPIWDESRAQRSSEDVIRRQKLEHYEVKEFQKQDFKKAQVIMGDGRVVELSSDEEYDPVTNKPVHVPSTLMAPYMAPGSLKPVTLKESRAVTRSAARTSMAAAMASFRAAQLEKASTV